MAADLEKPGKSGVPIKKKVAGEGDRTSGNDLGKALRTIYDEAVQEDVPSELLDLLGKLR